MSCYCRIISVVNHGMVKYTWENPSLALLEGFPKFPRIQVNLMLAAFFLKFVVLFFLIMLLINVVLRNDRKHIFNLYWWNKRAFILPVEVFFFVDSGADLFFLKDQVLTQLILVLDSSVISLVKYVCQGLSKNWVRRHSISVTALRLLLRTMLEGCVPCLVFDTSHLMHPQSKNHERCSFTWQAWSLEWLECHMLQFHFTGDFAKQLDMGELLPAVRYGLLCFQWLLIFFSNSLAIYFIFFDCNLRISNFYRVLKKRLQGMIAIKRPPQGVVFTSYMSDFCQWFDCDRIYFMNFLADKCMVIRSCHHIKNYTLED